MHAPKCKNRNDGFIDELINNKFAGKWLAANTQSAHGRKQLLALRTKARLQNKDIDFGTHLDSTTDSEVGSNCSEMVHGKKLFSEVVKYGKSKDQSFPSSLSQPIPPVSPPPMQSHPQPSLQPNPNPQFKQNPKPPIPTPPIPLMSIEFGLDSLDLAYMDAEFDAVKAVRHEFTFNWLMANQPNDQATDDPGHDWVRPKNPSPAIDAAELSPFNFQSNNKFSLLNIEGEGDAETDSSIAIKKAYCKQKR